MSDLAPQCTKMKNRPKIRQITSGTQDIIYLFGVLRRFQHCIGHITTGSWKGRGNQYIEFARVLYCKLPTNGKQLPAFPHKTLTGIEPRPQRWEARVLPLCHRGPSQDINLSTKITEMRTTLDFVSAKLDVITWLQKDLKTATQVTAKLQQENKQKDA